MSSPVAVAPAPSDARAAVQHGHDVDHNFLPDFTWAAVGGGAALAACVLILMLSASLGGGPSISAYGRELAAAFLAGFLVILVARSLTARS
jgi:hypothetical protein